jgi:hypothetical protein
LVSSRTVNTTAITDEKIDDIIRELEELGLTGSYTKNLLLATEYNASDIIKYIHALRTEVSYSPNYGNDTCRLLCRFSKYHNNKPFKDVTRDDIIKFLDSLEIRDSRPTAQVDRNV